MPRKTNQNKKKQAKPKAKRALPSNLAIRPILSPCSRDYLKVLTNPFQGFPQPPCVPDTIAMPSYKFKTMSRGVFTVGTQGVGYVAYSPYQWLSNTPAGQHTQAAFTGTLYTAVPPVGVIGFLNDSVFGSGSTVGRSVRVVGAGLKVRYTGTELNRAGRVLLYFQSGTQVIQNGAISSFLQDKRAITVPATRREESVCYLPTTSTDLYFQEATSFPTGLQKMLIMVDGAVPGTSWEYEAVSFFEVLGPSLPDLTKSHSDPVGMAAVIDSIPTTISAATPAQQEQTMTAKALAAVYNGMSAAVPYVANASAQIAASYLAGPTGAHAASRLFLPDAPRMRVEEWE